MALASAAAYMSHRAGAPIYVLLLPAGFSLFVYAFFVLTLEISAQGLAFTLTPFVRRHYAWSRIAAAEVVRYDPLLDFGGWGFRYSFRKRAWAYSVSGSWAIKVELRGGKRVYIGIKAADADRLAQAIARLQP